MTKPHWQGGSGGKGSASRNMEITAEEFANNWDRIFGKKKGNNNELRKGCNDGQLEESSRTGGAEYSQESGGSVPTTDDYPHDRISSDSNH